MVVHPRERRSKCTVEPLRSRDDFVFVRFPSKVPVVLDNYVRLGMDGPELSSEDAESGLLVLDGTWKLASRMEPFYSDLPVRSLPQIATAYPRVSQLYQDPSDGLATIEAVYMALKLMNPPLQISLERPFSGTQRLGSGAII
jgi:pre-rRNA-processing protein TSR3